MLDDICVYLKTSVALCTDLLNVGLAKQNYYLFFPYFFFFINDIENHEEKRHIEWFSVVIFR